MPSLRCKQDVFSKQQCYWSPSSTLRSRMTFQNFPKSVGKVPKWPSKFQGMSIQNPWWNPRVQWRSLNYGHSLRVQSPSSKFPYISRIFSVAALVKFLLRFVFVSFFVFIFFFVSFSFRFFVQNENDRFVNELFVNDR